MDKKLTIEKTVTLDAPILKVWDALTNPEWTKKYMYGYEVHSEWKVGSPICWTTYINGKKHIRKGEVLQIEPHKVLKISDFNPDGRLKDIKSNYAKVTYELFSEKDVQTTLKVTDDCAADEKSCTESNQFCDVVLSM